jgi:hypothetical protein
VRVGRESDSVAFYASALAKPRVETYPASLDLAGERG